MFTFLFVSALHTSFSFPESGGFAEASSFASLASEAASLSDESAALDSMDSFASEDSFDSSGSEESESEMDPPANGVTLLNLDVLILRTGQYLEDNFEFFVHFDVVVTLPIEGIRSQLEVSDFDLRYLLNADRPESKELQDWLLRRRLRRFIPTRVYIDVSLSLHFRTYGTTGNNIHGSGATVVAHFDKLDRLQGGRSVVFTDGSEQEFQGLPSSYFALHA